MPNAGDSYTVKIKEAHIMWGQYHPSRHSHTRREIYGEGYIKIPARVSYDLNIFNKSNPFGISARYHCTSYDSYYEGWLLAQGNQSNPIYAKQFAEEGNLKGIGDWYDYVGANVGDYIKVFFISPNRMIIEHSMNPYRFHI